MLTTEERNSFILKNIDLPKKISFGYKGYKLDMDDMVQEGMLGLIKAASKFDKSKLTDDDDGDDNLNKLFCSYAITWIKAYMYDYAIKNFHVANVATTKAHRKLFFSIRKEKADPELFFTNKEVTALSQKYGVNESDVRTMEMRMSSRGNDYYYMGAKLDEFDDNLDYNDFFIDYTSDPCLIAEKNDNDTERTKVINAALLKLPVRSQDIIKQRYLSNVKTTLVDLGTVYNISAERVNQVEKQAIQKLRKVIGKRL
jgi:RNA polymerase sigma-32 factor